MLDYLSPQILQQTFSKISGQITVQKYFGKVALYVGNTQQSGPLVEKIWKKGFQQIKSDKAGHKNILILGLGAGTITDVINRFYPDSETIGVEIDSKIVDVGKKYFNLGSLGNLRILCKDASLFIEKNEEKFDLILVDLYLGQKFPEKFEYSEFLSNLSQTMSKKGLVVFNRLTTKTSNFVLEKFVDKLSKYFKIDKTLKVDFNTLIFCSRE
jgi:spermidine synthase